MSGVFKKIKKGFVENLENFAMGGQSGPLGQTIRGPLRFI
jgi:hypothetical protein